jgi:hypothetical protein
VLVWALGSALAWVRRSARVLEWALAPLSGLVWAPAWVRRSALALAPVSVLRSVRASALAWVRRSARMLERALAPLSGLV